MEDSGRCLEQHRILKARGESCVLPQYRRTHVEKACETFLQYAPGACGAKSWKLFLQYVRLVLAKNLGSLCCTMFGGLLTTAADMRAGDGGTLWDIAVAGRPVHTGRSEKQRRSFTHSVLNAVNPRKYITSDSEEAPRTPNSNVDSRVACPFFVLPRPFHQH